MTTTEQSVFAFSEPTPKCSPGKWRHNVYGVPSVVRYHTYDFVKEYGRPYDPRAMKRALLEQLRAAGETYVPYSKLATSVEAHGDCVLSGEMLNRLDLWGYIEKKPKYHCADSMAPDLPPIPYRGFEFQYRLKQQP
jgi:hypothetical protein